MDLNSPTHASWHALGQLVCKRCGLKTSDSGFFHAHNCKKKQVFAEISYSSETRTFTCSLCNTDLAETAFQGHLGLHLGHEATYSCSYCIEHFKSRSLISHHQETVHSSWKPKFTITLSREAKNLMIKARNNCGNRKTVYKPINSDVIPRSFEVVASSSDSAEISYTDEVDLPSLPSKPGHTKSSKRLTQGGNKPAAPSQPNRTVLQTPQSISIPTSTTFAAPSVTATACPPPHGMFISQPNRTVLQTSQSRPNATSTTFAAPPVTATACPPPGSMIILRMPAAYQGIGDWEYTSGRMSTPTGLSRTVSSSSIFFPPNAFNTLLFQPVTPQAKNMNGPKSKSSSSSELNAKMPSINSVPSLDPPRLQNSATQSSVLLVDESERLSVVHNYPANNVCSSPLNSAENSSFNTAEASHPPGQFFIVADNVNKQLNNGKVKEESNTSDISDSFLPAVSNNELTIPSSTEEFHSSNKKGFDPNSKQHLRVVKGFFLCLKCRLKYSSAKYDSFFRHIWQIHTHEGNFSCCPNGYSSRCYLLNDIIYEIYNLSHEQMSDEVKNYLKFNQPNVQENSSVGCFAEHGSITDTSCDGKQKANSDDANCKIVQSGENLPSVDESRSLSLNLNNEPPVSTSQSVITCQESVLPQSHKAVPVYEQSGNLRSSSLNREVTIPRVETESQVVIPSGRLGDLSQNVSKEKSAACGNSSSNALSIHSSKYGTEKAISHKDRNSTDSNLSDVCEIFFYKCGIQNCLYSTHESSAFRQHMEESHSSTSSIFFPCIYCGYFSTAIDDLLEHMNGHIGNEKKTFSCSLLESNDKIAQFENQDSHRVITMLKNSMKALDQSDDCFQFACNVCETVFESVAELQTHLQLSLLKVIQCKYCDGYFLHSASCQRHISKAHPGLNRYYGVKLKLLCKDRKAHRNTHELLKEKKMQVSNSVQNVEYRAESSSEIQVETESSDVLTRPLEPIEGFLTAKGKVTVESEGKADGNNFDESAAKCDSLREATSASPLLQPGKSDFVPTRNLVTETGVVSALEENGKIKAAEKITDVIISVEDNNESENTQSYSGYKGERELVAEGNFNLGKGILNREINSSEIRPENNLHDQEPNSEATPGSSPRNETVEKDERTLNREPVNSEVRLVTDRQNIETESLSRKETTEKDEKIFNKEKVNCEIRQKTDSQDHEQNSEVTTGTSVRKETFNSEKVSHKIGLECNSQDQRQNSEAIIEHSSGKEIAEKDSRMEINEAVSLEKETFNSEIRQETINQDQGQHSEVTSGDETAEKESKKEKAEDHSTEEGIILNSSITKNVNQARDVEKQHNQDDMKQSENLSNTLTNSHDKADTVKHHHELEKNSHKKGNVEEECRQNNLLTGNDEDQIAENLSEKSGAVGTVSETSTNNFSEYQRDSTHINAKSDLPPDFSFAYVKGSSSEEKTDESYKKVIDRIPQESQDLSEKVDNVLSTTQEEEPKYTLSVIKTENQGASKICDIPCRVNHGAQNTDQVEKESMPEEEGFSPTHNMSSAARPLTCFVCEYRAPSVTSFYNHILQKKHKLSDKGCPPPEIEPIKCIKCTYVANDSPDFASHILSVHDGLVEPVNDEQAGLEKTPLPASNILKRIKSGDQIVPFTEQASVASDQEMDFLEEKLDEADGGNSPSSTSGKKSPLTSKPHSKECIVTSKQFQSMTSMSKQEGNKICTTADIALQPVVLLNKERPILGLSESHYKVDIAKDDLSSNEVEEEDRNVSKKETFSLDSAGTEEGSYPMFKCSICSSFISYSYTTVKQHLKSRHPFESAKIHRINHGNSKDVDVAKKMKPVITYECVHRGCHFATEWNSTLMRKHIKKCHPYYSCGYCGNHYSVLLHLYNHQKFVHRDLMENIVKSDIPLEKLFKKKSQLQCHDDSVGKTDREMRTNTETKENKPNKQEKSIIKASKSKSEKNLEEEISEVRKGSVVACDKDAGGGALNRESVKKGTELQNLPKKISTSCYGPRHESHLKNSDDEARKSREISETVLIKQSFSNPKPMKEKGKRKYSTMLSDETVTAIMPQGRVKKDSSTSVRKDSKLKQKILTQLKRSHEQISSSVSTLDAETFGNSQKLSTADNSEKKKVKVVHQTDHRTDPEKGALVVKSFGSKNLETSETTTHTADKISKTDGITDDCGNKHSNDKRTLSMEDYPLQCKICKVFMKCVRDIEDHFKWLHQRDAIELVDRKSQCVFANSGKLTSGAKSMSSLPNPHLCNYCSFRHKNKSIVENHQARVHPQEKINIVTLHSPDTPQLDDLNTALAASELSIPAADTKDASDVRRVSSPTPTYYHCYLCDTCHKSQFLFRLHLAKHPGFKYKTILSTMDGLIVCPTCGYIANGNNDLAQHTGMHMDERRFKCSLCDFDSHTKRGFGPHMKNVHGDEEAEVIDRQKFLENADMRRKVVNLDPRVKLVDPFKQHPNYLRALLVKHDIQMLDVVADVCSNILEQNDDRYFFVNTDEIE